MTWFRCGGIPVTLKNAMNAVLNKKFGTSSQNYPPNGWPDEVNLLGPLPVKSASGAIASFSDGADGVPVKSCVVSFLPSGGGGTPSAPVAITGVSGLSVTRADKPITSNMFESGSFSENKPVGTSYDDMKITNTSRSRVKELIPVSSSGFTISCKTGYNLFLCYFDNNALYKETYDGWLNSKLVTQTDGYYVAVDFRRSDNGTIQASDFENAQILIKTSSDVVVTDTFGQTIYGGSRDLTKDKASVTYVKKTFDGTENWRAYTNQNGVFLVLSDMKSSLYGDGVCNIFTTAHSASDVTSLSMTFGVNNGVIYINRLFDGAISGVTDVASWKTWLTNNTCEVAYELATPTEITGLTPHEIDTLYGDNNIYADTGTTTVEYRADIDLALNALQGSRSLSASLMRSESTEEVSEPEEIIQNTEEQEGENDER